MPSIQNRFWCWTLNNYDETELVALRTRLSQKEEVRYAYFAREVGEGGTPHLQGYVAFRDKISSKKAKSFLGQRAHVEVRKGPEETAISYCKKGTQSKTEWDSLGCFGPNYGDSLDGEEFGDLIRTPGKRCDLDEFKNAVKSGVFNKCILREDFSLVAAKYHRFFDSYILDNKPKVVPPSFPLHGWQRALTEHLALSPDDRHVLFVVDQKGNQGKTWFALQYIHLHDNSCMLNFGKKADMAHALPDDVRVLFLNITREQIDQINYSFLESCKDGFVFSPKYDSCIKRFKPMHVVVMMNEEPDMSKLSQDRYTFLRIRGPNSFSFN